MNASSQRALLILSLILAGVYGFAFIVPVNFIPAPSPLLDADQVAALYRESNLQFRIGIVLLLISSGFFSALSAVVTIHMYQEEIGPPIWTVLFATTSVIQSLLLGLSPALWGAAAFSIDRAPELTLLIHQTAWLVFISPVGYFPLTMGSIVVVSLSHKRKSEQNSAFPRWLGWLTLYVAITGELGFTVQIFKTGLFAWNGIFPFYLPAVLYGVWITAITVLLWRAISRQETTANLF